METFIRLWQSDLTRFEIAQKIGSTSARVSAKAAYLKRKYNIPLKSKTGRGRPSKEDWDVLRQLAASLNDDNNDAGTTQKQGQS